MLQSMESQRVGHDLITEEQQFKKRRNDNLNKTHLYILH